MDSFGYERSDQDSGCSSLKDDEEVVAVPAPR